MDKSEEHEVTCFYEQDKLTESIDKCNEWNEQDEESKAAEDKNKESSSKEISSLSLITSQLLYCISFHHFQICLTR